MLLVVDARAGLRAGDAELAETLRGAAQAGPRRRQQNRPAPTTSRSPPSSTGSGSASRIAVSATHGLGTGDLLDPIVERARRPARAGRARDDAVRGSR